MRETRWFRLIVIAMLSSLVLVACGGGSDDGGEEEEAAQEVPVADYVSQFCQSMIDWQNEVEALSTSFREDVTLSSDLSPEEKKEALVGYFEDLKGQTQEFISSVEDAGIPDVQGGQDISEEFLSGFRQLIGAIEDVEGQTGEIPTDSLESYNASAQELVGQMQTSFQTIGDTLTQIDSQAIDQAFNNEEACSQIQT